MDPDRFETWVVGGDGSELWRRAEELGVRTVRFHRLRERVALLDDAVVLWQLVRLIRRERFSVVHTHCAKAGFLGRLAAWFAGAPVIVHTFHAFATHPFMGRAKRAWFGSLERAVRPLAHRYVAVSPLVAREAVEKRLAEPGTVEVVPSAIEMDEVPIAPDPTVRRELGIAEDGPIVGWVGRMVIQKAPLDFVRMAALVRRTHPQATFVMVGDASHESRPLDAATHREAARLGVNVLFTGFRPDAPRIASAFDVFVVSSIYEGLGRGLTEALASGRAVVATAVNGVPDLVVPGTTGLLADAGNPASLAEGVRWLLDHPDEAGRMGTTARARVRELFDQRTMCVTLDRLYSRLLGVPPIEGRGAEHEA
jgi:glycosyltransferase involved in cell wall biosynthesis